MSEADAQQSGLRAGGRASAVHAWLVWWVLGAALFDRVPLSGLVLGAVAAALGATDAVLVRRQRRTLLRLQAGWPVPALSALPALISDLAPLAGALYARGLGRRPVRRTIHELPFATVGDAPERWRCAS